MLRSALVASLAALSMLSVSTLFPEDSIRAAEGDAPKPLTAADILVDASRIAEPVENPQAGQPLLAQDAPDQPKVPEPVAMPTVMAEEAAAQSLAELVERHNDGAATLDEQARCLASTIYHESKSESLAGQLAVAKVVLARAQSGRFPSSICGVVTQRGQFSFVRGGTVPTPPNNRQWRTAVAISRIALADSWDSPVEGALFFHARRVSPGWRLVKLGAVDNHIFYR